jgi:hypothetical protein
VLCRKIGQINGQKSAEGQSKNEFAMLKACVVGDPSGGYIIPDTFLPDPSSFLKNLSVNSYQLPKNLTLLYSNF